MEGSRVGSEVGLEKEHILNFFNEIFGVIYRRIQGKMVKPSLVISVKGMTKAVL